MRFSLLTVYARRGDRVDGYWIQNHSGTIETAQARARAVEAVNSNKITIAIVEEVPSPVPMLDNWVDRLVLA